MNALVSTAAVAIACSVALGAQSGDTPQARSDQKPANVVTATGCVAAGAGAGEFTLTDATVMPAAAAAKEGMPPAKGKMAADHAMSYLLSGTVADLKAHVGHKVTVTGTLVKPDLPKVTPPSERDKASRPMTGGTLTVTAVKMVSATCP